MDNGRIDEQKLINTLKGLLKQFLPSDSIPMEKTVQKFLDIKLKGLSPVENSDGNGIFFMKGDRLTLFYNKRHNRLSYPQEVLFLLMKMFKIDEDISEEILKRWFETNFNLKVDQMYNDLS